MCLVPILWVVMHNLVTTKEVIFIGYLCFKLSQIHVKITEMDSSLCFLMGLYGLSPVRLIRRISLADWAPTLISFYNEFE